MDEAPPTWRQEEKEMGLKMPSRSSKCAELVNGNSLEGLNRLKEKVLFKLHNNKEHSLGHC